MTYQKTLEVFSHDWGTFYFTLGRGKPQRPIEQIWHTHRGRILGYFDITEIVRNLGDNLRRLRRISGEKSEWQIKLMNWVAVCPPPFHPLAEKIYHEGFRGWRYFDLESYRGTIDSKIRI